MTHGIIEFKIGSMGNRLHWVLATLLLLALVSCQAPATRIEVQNARIGSAPSQSLAEVLATELLNASLKDPGSAIIQFGAVRKGAYQATSGGSNYFAWELPALVNAKNGFGAYSGNSPYFFYFVDDRPVALKYSRDYRGVEIEEVVVLGSGGVPASKALPASK